MQTKDLQGLLTTNSAESSYEFARQLEIDLSAIVLWFKWYKKNARKEAAKLHSVSLFALW